MAKQHHIGIQKLIKKYNDLIYIFVNNIGNYNNMIIKFVSCFSYARIIGLQRLRSIQLLIMPILWILVLACSNVFQFLWLSLIFIISAIVVHAIKSIINNIDNKNFENLSITQIVKLLTVLLGIEITILLFLPAKAIYIRILIIGVTIACSIIKKWDDVLKILLECVWYLAIFMAWFTVHKHFSFTPLLIYLATIVGAIVNYFLYENQNTMGVVLSEKQKRVILYQYRVSISLLGIVGLNAKLNLIFFPILGLILWGLNTKIINIVSSFESHQNYSQIKLNYALLIFLAFAIGKI